MTNDNNGFVQLCEKLATIDLFGDGPPIPPWGDSPTLEAVEQVIGIGAPALPQTYRDGYVTPLTENLRSVLRQTPANLVETLAGAVYEHTPESEVRQQLQRFLAVISNLYRSFLSKAKRAAVDVPLASVFPPLAVFQHSGASGPFTIPSDEESRLFGAKIGVVSLPSTYRDHPVLWASLAHETGGHDVTHADEGLLPELAIGVQALFGVDPLRTGQQPSHRQLDGLLWSYWIDEAAADIYGVLNIGPTFALNLAAFFAALNNRATGAVIPSLRTQSGHTEDDLTLDPHPTDILRLHLAIGAIENLNGLSAMTRDKYITELEQLAGLCAQGANTVEIQGDVAIDRDRWIRVNTRRPLEDMQKSARLVGAYIVTAKLQALANHSIQDIETWDDADELTAQQIATAFQGTASVADMGDDAQLLAGATLTLVAQPDRYNTVTERLAQALDRSYEQDPVWSAPTPHLVFIRHHFRGPDAPELGFIWR